MVVYPTDLCLNDLVKMIISTRKSATVLAFRNRGFKTSTGLTDIAREMFLKYLKIYFQPFYGVYKCMANRAYI